MVCAEPDTLCSSMSLCACVGESSLMGGRAHRTARTGPAHRDRGGNRLRERLDHARAAHGVCGTLRQEPLWSAFEGPRRRRDHAHAESEELTQLILSGFRLFICTALTTVCATKAPRDS